MNRKEKIIFDKLKNKKVQGKLDYTFSITLKLMIMCIVIAIVSLIFISSRLRTFYQVSYNNVTLASQSQSSLQEGAKNMLHACLVQDELRLPGRENQEKGLLLWQTRSVNLLRTVHNRRPTQEN